MPLVVPAERLPLKTYTTADGLVRDYITRIVRDSHGFLWFCTPEGLSRFNGYDFVNYGVDQGLPHRAVNDLLEARDGSYWIATGAGLVHFNPPAQPDSRLNNSSSTAVAGASPPEKRFIVYQPGEGERAQTVNALVEDRAGVIWCGTDAGLYRLERTQGRWALAFVNIGLLTDYGNDAMVSTFMEDRSGTLWIGTASGLYRRQPDGRVEHYTTHKGLPHDDVRALLEDRKGQVWMGTTVGLYQLVPQPTPQQAAIAQSYTVRNGLASNWITSLFESGDGRLWVGTQSGLCEFVSSTNQAGQVFRSYTTVQGLSGNEIQSLAEDSDGNLWIGTESGGAMKVARNGFATYLETDGLSDTRIASIFEDRAGELCVISGRAGEIFIHRFSDGRFIDTGPNLSQINYGWGWNQIAFQDHSGEWWIPTDQGIYRFPRASGVEQLRQMHPKAVYTSRDGLGSDQVFRLYEDSHGDIWISTITPNRDAITRWVRATGAFQRYSEADGVPRFMAPTVFREDASGQLWIGFYDGSVCHYRDGRFQRFTATGRLPAGLIRDLYFDQSGRLWIATSSGGVIRVDQPGSETPHFVSYTTTSGLASNQVTCVTEDEQGRIYIGTARGVDRLDPASGRIRHYSVADGLANDFVNVAYRDRQGSLWFGTLKGLSRLFPQPDRPHSPPPILISGLRIVGEARALSEFGETNVTGLLLGPNENQLQLDFIGLSFGVGETLRYQFKLEGADRDWGPATAERTVNYAHLAPGTYRFVVRAVNAEGIASAVPAIVSFKILRPIWQRWWFVALATLGCAGLFYVAYKYRVQRVLELERVRTRIATDLHDDIGSSLSRMAILSEVIKHDPAAMRRESVERLTDIAETARGLVDTMSDIVWAIDPRRDDLHSVVLRVRQFAADVLEAKGIKWQFQAAPEFEHTKLTPEQRRHLFLIFKEALTNIARHADCLNVSLDITVSGDQLRAEIRDDGKGFPSRTDGSSGDDGRGGHGLENMRTRAEQVGGTVHVNSTPGSGTQITLTMPLNWGHGMNMLFSRWRK